MLFRSLLHRRMLSPGRATVGSTDPHARVARLPETQPGPSDAALPHRPDRAQRASPHAASPTVPRRPCSSRTARPLLLPHGRQAVASLASPRPQPLAERLVDHTGPWPSLPKIQFFLSAYMLARPLGLDRWRLACLHKLCLFPLRLLPFSKIPWLGFLPSLRSPCPRLLFLLPFVPGPPAGRTSTSSNKGKLQLLSFDCGGNFLQDLRTGASNRVSMHSRKFSYPIVFTNH